MNGPPKMGWRRAVGAGRRAAFLRVRRWSLRRHGPDTLPLTIARRRIYILPTRIGVALGLLLVAMLIAGLNYNSNLGLAFGFLLSSLVLVAMHHCHRNLQGLGVDLPACETDGFAQGGATLEFRLHNAAGVDRRDIEVRCGDGRILESIAPHALASALLGMATPARGVLRFDFFEVRTRYPFGWFRAWTYVQCPLAIHVAPTPIGVIAPPAAAAAHGHFAPAEHRGEDDFAGLRAYEAGVPLKHMAWKVLARGGEPAVRSYSGLAAQPQWLDWNALPHLDAEARLSQLCKWVLDSERSQRVYGLRIPGMELSPSHGAMHRRACLRALAGFHGP